VRLSETVCATKVTELFPFRNHRLLVSLLILFPLIAGIWLTADTLSAPVPRPIGEPPASLDARPAQFLSRSGSVIHGWLCPGHVGRGAVPLLHGVRGDRRDMVSRAEFLHRAGYTVLLIDLQSHGESRGRRITFGYLESRDVAAALEFLTREAPGERIGVIGQSLGAAAFVLAKPRPNVSALVLEWMYPTIDQAVQDRLRLHLGWLGPILAPLLELSLEPFLGITPDDLRPIDSMSSVHAPVFILAGTNDEHTTWKETQAIFDAQSHLSNCGWCLGPRTSTCTRSPRRNTNTRSSTILLPTSRRARAHRAFRLHVHGPLQRLSGVHLRYFE